MPLDKQQRKALRQEARQIREQFTKLWSDDPASVNRREDLRKRYEEIGEILRLERSRVLKECREIWEDFASLRSDQEDRRGALLAQYSELYHVLRKDRPAAQQPVPGSEEDIPSPEELAAGRQPPGAEVVFDFSSFIFSEEVSSRPAARPAAPDVPISQRETVVSKPLPESPDFIPSSPPPLPGHAQVQPPQDFIPAPPETPAPRASEPVVTDALQDEQWVVDESAPAAGAAAEPAETTQDESGISQDDEGFLSHVSPSDLIAMAGDTGDVENVLDPASDVEPDLLEQFAAVEAGYDTPDANAKATASPSDPFAIEEDDAGLIDGPEAPELPVIGAGEEGAPLVYDLPATEPSTGGPNENIQDEVPAAEGDADDEEGFLDHISPAELVAMVEEEDSSPDGTQGAEATIVGDTGDIENVLDPKSDIEPDLVQTFKAVEAGFDAPDAPGKATGSPVDPFAIELDDAGLPEHQEPAELPSTEAILEGAPGTADLIATEPSTGGAEPFGQFADVGDDRQENPVELAADLALREHQEARQELEEHSGLPEHAATLDPRSDKEPDLVDIFTAVEQGEDRPDAANKATASPSDPFAIEHEDAGLIDAAAAPELPIDKSAREGQPEVADIAAAEPSSAAADVLPALADELGQPPLLDADNLGDWADFEVTDMPQEPAPADTELPAIRGRDQEDGAADSGSWDSLRKGGDDHTASSKPEHPLGMNNGDAAPFEDDVVFDFEPGEQDREHLKFEALEPADVLELEGYLDEPISLELITLKPLVYDFDEAPADNLPAHITPETIVLPATLSKPANAPERITPSVTPAASVTSSSTTVTRRQLDWSTPLEDTPPPREPFPWRAVLGAAFMLGLGVACLLSTQLQLLLRPIGVIVLLLGSVIFGFAIWRILNRAHLVDELDAARILENWEARRNQDQATLEPSFEDGPTQTA